jgi:predicted acetyltransferase
LKLDELELFGNYVSDAFVMDSERAASWLELSVKSSLHDTRVLEEDGEIKAGLRIIYPDLWLGQGKVKMAGISSVATPPQHRRQGCINRLLEAVMREHREAGYNISTLYPFYFPFYKKFGYELAANSKKIKVKMSALQKFRPKAKGRWREISHADWQILNVLYESYCRGNFGLITRSEFRWSWAILRQRLKDTKHAYVWYNQEGEARAYVIYNMHTIKDWDREMQIQEMVWRDYTARHEVLAFLANHDSQAEAVIWETNPDDAFFALLDDPREAEQTLSPGYMLRILDAKKALLERSWQVHTPSAFTLTLTDKLLEWNNLTLRIEAIGHKIQIETLPQDYKSGLSCDIRQLAQLYAGYLSPVKLAELGLLDVRSELDLMAAQSLFSPSGQPTAFMADYF